MNLQITNQIFYKNLRYIKTFILKLPMLILFYLIQMALKAIFL